MLRQDRKVRRGKNVLRKGDKEIRGDMEIDGTVATGSPDA
jgi:hypothetical protein